MEFSLNGFTEFAEFSDKNVCYYSKRAWTCHPATSCVRDQDATTAPARHRWEAASLNWAPIHASVIYQFLCIQWIPVPFRKKSNLRSMCWCHQNKIQALCGCRKLHVTAVNEFVQRTISLTAVLYTRWLVMNTCCHARWIVVVAMRYLCAR